MTKPANTIVPPVWTAWQKWLFRTLSIFFFLLAFPLDWKFWRGLFTADWSHFQDLFALTIYTPQFIATPKWGLASYGNIGLALLLAIIGGLIWSLMQRNRSEYNREYFWLRVLLRYRLALGAIGYGMIKFFPLQFPQLTLSDLHTNYGDFLPWKIYYLTNGAAVAYYEQSLGLLEIAGGLLLLWRRSVVVGAGLIAAILTNVVLANFAYEIGDHIYSSYLLLIALALIAHDGPRLYNLLVSEKLARADNFAPLPAAPGWRRTRVALKGAFLLFIGIYGAGTYATYSHERWPYPETGGLKGASGYYNVREFSFNGGTRPYSLVDPVRWQNVVIEPWSTISIRINRPVKTVLANPPVAFQESEERIYEVAGNGGRHFYGYAVDAAKGTLQLKGKNDPSENFALDYKYLDDGALLLTGKNQTGDVLRVVIEKIDKKYLLKEGRRKPISIY